MQLFLFIPRLVHCHSSLPVTPLRQMAENKTLEDTVSMVTWGDADLVTAGNVKSPHISPQNLL